MKIKDKSLEIRVPNDSAFRFETSTHLPKLHQNMIFIGCRGSGKGVSMSNMIRMLPFDRVLCISPTFKSNKEILKDLNINEEDVFCPDDKDVIEKIMKIGEQEVEDLERYRSDLKMFNKFKKLLQSSSQFIPDELLLQFYDGASFKPPEHKYNGREPILALIVDDCQGTNLFRNKRFQNCVIRHRHCFEFSQGGALGISLFICCQNYKAAAGGGLPRAIRNNCTSMVLFKTKDKKTLKEIAEEVAGEVDEETFLNVYQRATDEPHSFLFIDLNKKKEHLSMFRKNFNEYIQP